MKGVLIVLNYVFSHLCFWPSFLRVSRWVSSSFLTIFESSASISELLDVHISDSSINRLEIEASTTLIAGVTSLSLVTGPILLYTCVTFMCRLYFENSVCSSISWLSPYVKALIVLHIVYHPTFYFLHSSELSSVLKNWSFVFSQ